MPPGAELLEVIHFGSPGVSSWHQLVIAVLIPKYRKQLCTSVGRSDQGVKGEVKWPHMKTPLQIWMVWIILARSSAHGM